MHETEHAPPHDPQRWTADLRLRYGKTPRGTQTLTREHTGPLRVLKTLYPEGAEIAHTVIVHPPAGIVATDSLRLSVQCDANAHAVLTTPGAQKWYRATAQLPRDATGGSAHTRVHVGAGGCVEWLPQESIVFAGCVGTQALQIDLDAGAKTIAWEMLQLGRDAVTQRFAGGRFTQEFAVRITGRRVLAERMVLRGDDVGLVCPTSGRPARALGAMVVVGATSPKTLLDEIRALEMPFCTFGATLLAENCMFIKAIGTEIEPLRTLFVRIREHARRSLCDVDAKPLRIWKT